MEKINLIGRKYGKLIVISESMTNKKGKPLKWLCKCECGNEKIILGTSLKEGHSKSCGCIKKGKVRENLIGKKYSRLLVTAFAGVSKSGNSVWECLCDCGNTTITIGCGLKNGKSKSCGCWAIECTKERNKTHGDSINNKMSSEYACWCSMKSRCYNPNDQRYKTYGARGIKVCKRWLNSFENFLSDMGRRPTPDHSLDRKNNNKDYKPSNCRWSTDDVQSKNKSNNRWFSHAGKKMILKDWATYFRVCHTTLIMHLKKKTFKEVYKFYKNKNENYI